jgi:glycine/D-amino acid oxidase-like deaminating enzyme
VNLQVARQHSLYFRPPRNMGRFNPSHFPVFSASGRGFSGFPVHIHGFMRIGRDKGVSPCPGVDAAAAPDPVFQKKCRAFLDEFIPDLADFSEWEDRIGYTARTPDGDFILDRLPGTENGFLAVGFSGKAPMFAPLVGKVMDSMLHRLKPEINMHRFRLGRLEPAP